MISSVKKFKKSIIEDERREVVTDLQEFFLRPSVQYMKPFLICKILAYPVKQHFGHQGINSTSLQPESDRQNIMVLLSVTASVSPGRGTDRC